MAAVLVVCAVAAESGDEAENSGESKAMQTSANNFENLVVLFMTISPVVNVRLCGNYSRHAHHSQAAPKRLEQTQAFGLKHNE
jgi:hypothetical protein